MGFTTFVAGTKAKASEVNNNFRFTRGQFGFGDGSDGSRTISGNTTESAIVIKNYTNLTIDNTFTYTLKSGSVIFVSGTLTLTGDIAVESQDGSDAAADSPPQPGGGTGGRSGEAGGHITIFANTVVGAGNITALGDDGNNGGNGNATGSTDYDPAGSNPGSFSLHSGKLSGDAGGGTSATALVANNILLWNSLMLPLLSYGYGGNSGQYGEKNGSGSSDACDGGDGGAGGSFGGIGGNGDGGVTGATGFNKAGGGGGGGAGCGGLIVIVTLDNNSTVTLTVTGGDGGTEGAGDGGGAGGEGGGGSGGIIISIADTNFTTSEAGGTGANAGASGSVYEETWVT